MTNEPGQEASSQYQEVGSFDRRGPYPQMVAVLECLDCGALVQDERLHDRWHGRQT